MLRLLRPAEAAARRLVIVMARGLVVPPPAPPRLRKPKPTSTILRNGPGTGNRTGILMPPHLRPQASLSRAAPRTLALSLFDQLRPPRLYRPPIARTVPRISFPGFTAPSPVSPRRPPSPYDAIDARRLALRFQALASALDDLPRQARRFARWRARVKGAAQNKETRRPFRRISPLRPGRPPGWCRSPVHEVHEILNVAHGLAIWALKSPDTS